MKKFNFDKYYTPDKVVNLCIDKLVEIVGYDYDIVIEPSAGGGAFIKKLEDTFVDSSFEYYDLEPTGNKIKKLDYLELDIKRYKNKKVLVVGNPPFGSRNSLSVKFFKKSILYAKTIGFILPISQYKNNQQMYEFNLIKSLDIGPQVYYNETGDKRVVHCCFNIYERPDILNKKTSYKLDNFYIKEYRRGEETDITEECLGICAWGGSVGKTTNYVGQYAQEFYFYGDREIIDYCINFDWMNHRVYTATPSLYQWVIYEEVIRKFNLTPNTLDLEI